jgi:hypothetical protein
MSLEMAGLLDEFLAPGWRDRVDDPSVWDAVLAIPDERIWETRQAIRTYLFASSASVRASAGRKSTSPPRASWPRARCSTRAP